MTLVGGVGPPGRAGPNDSVPRHAGWSPVPSMTMASSGLDGAGDTPDRRHVLKGAVAGAVGAAVWHTPGVQVRDLAGARALAAGSAPLVETVVATSFTRTRGGNTFQHWGSTGGSTFYAVPFASGDVEIRVRRRARPHISSPLPVTGFSTTSTARL